VPRLYVVCQAEVRAPALIPWLREAWRVVEVDPDWADWDLAVKEADEQNSFNARDIASQVLSSRGPVLVLGQLKRSAVALLQERIGLRVVVTHEPTIGDSTDVYSAVQRALEQHLRGDPQVPRRLAVALMLVRKLLKGDYWGGGAKAKAFLSVEELAKGRGLDEQFADAAPEVANMLEMKGLLVKKTGDGHVKYGLNPKQRDDIYAFLTTWRVSNERLHKYLYGDVQCVSTRILDRLNI